MKKMKMDKEDKAEMKMGKMPSKKEEASEMKGAKPAKKAARSDVSGKAKGGAALGGMSSGESFMSSASISAPDSMGKIKRLQPDHSYS